VRVRNVTTTMIAKTSTEVSSSTVVVALTVASESMSSQTMPRGIVCAFVTAIFGCWYFDMMGLAISVSLAFVALSLRIKSCTMAREPFTKHAVERRVTDDPTTLSLTT
jgi:predicted glycosyl hydrolase (DUF1957 family)